MTCTSVKAPEEQTHITFSLDYETERLIFFMSLLIFPP